MSSHGIAAVQFPGGSRQWKPETSPQLRIEDRRATKPRFSDFRSAMDPPDFGSIPESGMLV
jgi:hypothetical protein